jgi:hypothetical protein
MNTFKVHKASPTIPGDEVDEATILIVPSIDTAAECRDQFQHDGIELAQALWNHLPGGTLDVLIGELLQRRASQFRIRFSSQDVTA